jgi:hypothetical protein
MALRQFTLADVPRPRTITTEICKLPEGRFGPWRDLAVSFAGLEPEEAAKLMTCAVLIEQARTLSGTAEPTEEQAPRGGRFDGIDLSRRKD